MRRSVLRLFGRLSSFRQILNALISSIVPGQALHSLLVTPSMKARLSRPDSLLAHAATTGGGSGEAPPPHPKQPTGLPHLFYRAESFRLSTDTRRLSLCKRSFAPESVSLL